MTNLPAVTDPFVVIDPVVDRELTDEECLAAALRWVNAIRGRYELPPLGALRPGVRNFGGGCVISESAREVTDGTVPIPRQSGRVRASASDDIPDGAITLEFSRNGQTKMKIAPPEVAEFVRRFDAGRYPQLDAKTSSALWGKR